MKNPLEAMEIVNLDHLGIVAGIIDEMELVEEVNKKVGLRVKEAVSPGQVMKAMILNGLGFLSAPLYLFENFFIGKATEHLIGEGVTAEQLNDDRIGRALDKYYQAGTTKLFTAIALKAAQKFQVEKESVHLDSSSISVEGEYKSEGICVADSALYTAENIGAMTGMKWITRVPLSIKEAQNNIIEIEEEEWEKSEIKGYKIATKLSEYGNIKQRWLVVESEIRKKAALKKISEQVEKQLENAKAGLRKLSKQEYACIADAEIGIKMLSDSWKYHEIKGIKCTEKVSNKSQSKTEKGNKEKTIVYQVTGEIEARELIIEGEKVKAGRFILATNILDKEEVSNEKILTEYKAQQSNERGFRFLKDPLFFTASVFVKKPERVEVIAMIMGLCLLVYNLAQRKLRKQLEIAQEGVRNQVNKITNKPTMRWIFQMFQAVHLVKINGKKQVSNLTQERQEILQHLGKDCCQYYLMISGV